MYSNPWTVIAENAPNIFRRNIPVYPELLQFHIIHVSKHVTKDQITVLILLSMFQNMLRKIKSPLWIRIPPLNDGKCRHRSTLCDLKPVIPVVTFLTKVYHVSGQCYDWWSPHPCSFTVNLGHLVNRVQVSCTFSKWKKSYKKDVDRRQGKGRRCCFGDRIYSFSCRAWYFALERFWRTGWIDPFV